MNPRAVSEICEGCITFISDRQSPGKHYSIETDRFLEEFMRQYVEKDIHNISIVTTERIQEYIQKRFPDWRGIAYYISDDPKLEFAKILNKEYNDPLSVRHPSAVVGDNVNIGTNVQLYPNVTIHPNTDIGDNTIIHAGTTIGGPGLNPVWDEENDEYVMFPQLGRVIIGKNVFIGSYAAIHRGTLTDTIIGDGCKFGPLIHIGHGRRIGKNVVIAASACIAGSGVVGDDTWIGPGAVVRDNVNIGKNVLIGVGCTIVKDIPDNVTVRNKFEWITKER